MTYPLLFLFALAPSLIWLAFFLKKDSHPEPNRMILLVFFLGALATLPAMYVEMYFEMFLGDFSSALSLSRTAFFVVYFLIGIALVEEFLKYLAVRVGAFSSKALDEPVDLMVYMIVAALGFAALENIFLLFDLIKTNSVSDVFLVNSVRFVQAVLLHALASGVFGYFLALSFIQRKIAGKRFSFKRRALFFFAGLALAALLHGFFNYYIFTMGNQSILLLLAPIIPLLAVGIFVSFGFQQLKSLWSKKLQ